MLTMLTAMLLLAAPAPPPVKEAWDRTKPRVSGAWVRRNPVPGRPWAGYLVIEGGGQPDRLVAASAPGLRVELHSMSMTGGVMKMAPIKGLAVPAGARVALASGGNHLMIFGGAGTAKSLPISLRFASGAVVVADAEVRAAGTAGPGMAGAEHSGH